MKYRLFYYHFIVFQEQMKCVLCVLKHAPVPWSNTICGICEDALNSKQNEFTVQIREQEKLVTCKIILKKYNLKHNNFTYAYVSIDHSLYMMYI